MKLMTVTNSEKLKVKQDTAKRLRKQIAEISFLNHKMLLDGNNIKNLFLEIIDNIYNAFNGGKNIFFTFQDEILRLLKIYLLAVFGCRNELGSHSPTLVRRV